MIHRSALLLSLLFLLLPARAQTPAAPPDTTRRPAPMALPEATVVGYGQNRPLRRTAAAVGVVDAAVVGRFNEAALTQAVNTLPGVRLEERATASYRLSVRGSTLRSPYGVRNVKVYYHDIPFTEASGSTPLNLLDASLIGRIEVLKGPAGSVYGAGTGGVAIFRNKQPQPGRSQAESGASVGSFGLRRFTAAAESSQQTADGRSSPLRAQFAHQTLDGYRQQSALRRDVATIDGEFRPSEKRTVAVHALYADIDYQLPGGLTRAQFEQNPRQARPGTTTSPGTVAQRTYYASRTALLGLTHEYRFSSRFSNQTTLYTTGSVIRTPYLVDFERNTQVGGGGRTRFNYRTALAGRTLNLAAGGEVQASFENGRSYQNRAGQTDTLRYDDEIGTRTGFVFGQAELELPAGFLLTAAASYNRLRYRIARRGGPALPGNYQLTRDFRPEVRPRVALLREFGPNLSVYGSVSTGFSPPSEEEIRPSDGSLNAGLQAERGTSYEAGARGQLLGQRLTYDVAAYDFRLRNTIVTRSNDQGIQLFYNAGDTRQRGLEVAARYALLPGPGQPAEASADGRAGAAGRPSADALSAFVSYAYNHYRFGSYQSGGSDFSGNRLTGSTPHTLTAGLDFAERFGFYFSPTASHQARVVLNDANTAYAPGYWVFGARGGWKRTVLRRLPLNLYAGLDNALDRRYSLGNDLNAFGGRYFQPAPGRNWYAGAQLKLNL